MSYITPLDVPNFFLLGVQKSSTTFLSKLLARHPDLCYGRAKEPHYFDSPNYETGIKNNIHEMRYLKNFNRCGRKITFDATPMNWLLASQIASAYTPSQLAAKKFIVVLRHPVDRELSWYSHQLRSCVYNLRRNPFTYEKDRQVIYKTLSSQKTCTSVLRSEKEFKKYNTSETDSQLIGLNFKTFHEYVQPPEQLRGDSHYAPLLLQWLKVINRDQLLILSFHDIATNITKVMNAISEFLQIPHWINGTLQPGHSSSLLSGTTLDCNTSLFLNKYFETVNKDLEMIINDRKPIFEPAFSKLYQGCKCKAIEK